MASNSTSNSTSPAELSLEVYADKTWLQGALLTAVAYGVVVALFPMCCHLLIAQMTRDNRRRTIGFLVYLTVMFITGTLCVGSAFEMTQLSFITNVDFPGGPQAFETVMFSIPVDDIGNIALLIGLWLADGLMVWRTYVIYQSIFIPIWITMCLPCLLWLASFVSGIFLATQESGPTMSLWVSSTVNMTLPVMALSLTLNCLTTVMILGRLLFFRYNAKKHLGAEHAEVYTGLAAMVVESSFLYFATFVTMMVCFLINNPLQNIFLQLVSEVQIIAPLLIVYRVAQGKAWTHETATRARARTAIHFKSNTAGGSSYTTGTGKSSGGALVASLGSESTNYQLETKIDQSSTSAFQDHPYSGSAV